VTSQKPSRWLDLVAFLLDRRYPVTREQIFAKVGGYDGEPESARRKFERDKDELRALGIDIETVPLPAAAGDEPATGYRLRPRNAYLPYLELVESAAPERPYPGLDRLTLTKAELTVLDRATHALAELKDSPLAAAAASARRKLSFDLPFTADAANRVLGWPVPEHARQALTVLQEAVIHRNAVTCRYFTMSRQTEAVRELEPWGLMFQWGRWYCVARARDRDDARLFRVDRMRDVKRVSGNDARFEVPHVFDVRQFIDLAPWEFGTGPVTSVQAVFSFPESRWIVNRGVGRVASEQAGQTTIEFEVRDQDAFLRWVLSFGRRARILEPRTWQDSLESLRADVAALYAEVVP
jgi:proteasome accessory factor B